MILLTSNCCLDSGWRADFKILIQPHVTLGWGETMAIQRLGRKFNRTGEAMTEVEASGWKFEAGGEGGV